MQHDAVKRARSYEDSAAATARAPSSDSAEVAAQVEPIACSPSDHSTQNSAGTRRGPPAARRSRNGLEGNEYDVTDYDVGDLVDARAATSSGAYLWFPCRVVAKKGVGRKVEYCCKSLKDDQNVSAVGGVITARCGSGRCCSVCT
jgi:hypothetical protein